MLSKLFTFGFVWLTVTYYCSGMFMICTHSCQLFREIQSDISLFHNLHAIGAWHSSIQRLLPISDTRVWKVQLVNWPESTLTRRTWQKWRLYRTQLRFCSQFEVKSERPRSLFWDMSLSRQILFCHKSNEPWGILETHIISKYLQVNKLTYINGENI